MKVFIVVTCLMVLLVKEGESSECDADTRLYNKDNIKIDFYTECALSAKPCLVKCCALGEVIYYRAKNHTCKSIEEADKILNFTDAIKAEIKTYAKLKILKVDGSASEKQFFEDFNILHRNKFDQNTLIFYQGDTNFTDDGNAVFKTTDGLKYDNVYVKSPRFCVDMVVGSKGKTPRTMYKYFLQLDDSCKKNIIANFLIYGNFVSAFFCFLILVVYKLLQSFYCKLYDKLTMAFVASLMAYAVLFAVQITLLYKTYRNDANQVIQVCTWLAPVLYYFLLSSFFWMNTMGFDIWWTFRNLRKVNHGGPPRSSNKKFCYYSLYALGMPAIITVITFWIDNADLPSYVIKPQFKLCRPDVSSNLVYRLYSQVPLLFVVLTNIGFFLFTVYNIRRMKNPILKMKSENSNSKNNSQIIIFIRLSIVMGINWVLELVQAPIRDNLPILGFVALNIWNACLGVMLFFVTVFRWSIFLKLCYRLNIENKWTRERNQLIRKTTSTEESKLSKSSTAFDRASESELPNTIVKTRDPLANNRLYVSMIPDPK